VITGGIVESGTIWPRPTQNTTSQFIIDLTGTRKAGTSVWINGSEKLYVGDGDWSAQLTLASGANALEIWEHQSGGTSKFKLAAQ
jgi:hypothetical protein